MGAEGKADLYGVFSALAVPRLPFAVNLWLYVRVDGVFGPAHWVVTLYRQGDDEPTAGLEVGDLMMEAFDVAHHFSFEWPGLLLEHFGAHELGLYLHGELVATAPLHIRPLS